MGDASLNVFQRVVRRWEAVYPYNAAQIMRVAGAIDAVRAGDAWERALRSLGLGQVRMIGRSSYRHEVLNGDVAPCRPATVPTDVTLDAWLTAEIVRPFNGPDVSPFRPFLRAGAGDSAEGCWLGVVYQHWVADSASVQLVMREWFVQLFDPGAARGSGLRQPTGGFWKLFGARGSWRLDESCLAAIRAHVRHRRVRKVGDYVSPRDYPTRVTLHRAPAGLADRLRGYARRKGLSVQDVLLAAVADVCFRYVPLQKRRGRRDLSVGSIVDLRRHAREELSDVFGMFLGFTHVVCTPEHVSCWDRLLEAVRAQRRANKRLGLAQGSMIWMAASMAVSPLVPDRLIYHFFRKELPMAGGLSNVTLNDTWVARYQPDPVREYVRVSPTGPLVPLAFAVTTLGAELNLALTCRQNLLSAERASQVAGAFLDRLTRAVDTRP